jgi:hypothetical protein
MAASSEPVRAGQENDMDEPTQDLTASGISRGESGTRTSPTWAGFPEVSRRTVVKGAAWSVPVVMMAKVPAFASGHAGTEDLTIDFGASTACKIPGESWGDECWNKGYVLWASVVNNTSQTIYVTDVSFMSVGGVTQCFVGFSVPSESGCSTLVPCVEIPPNSTKIVGIFSNAATDSASNLVVVNLEYNFEGCGAADNLTSENSGQVTGSPWTKGVGSCQFPPGCTGGVNSPPNICGHPCEV